MSTTEILIAGFGGQGVLFTGKFVAYKGLTEGKEITWLPSYGPEMRGGTASCTVILSDTPIGSPMTTAPDILIAMNLPSFEKYEMSVKAGGTVIADSSLIDCGTKREDINFCALPATALANEASLAGLSNMIMLGKAIKETGCVAYEGLEEAFNKIVSAKHKDLIEANIKAINLGYEYKE